MSISKTCEASVQGSSTTCTEKSTKIDLVKEQVNEKLRAFSKDFANHDVLQKYLETAHHILLSADAKRIRSFLPVLIADTNGFDREACFKYGITIELLHYSSLIHDDVIDADTIRRGCPTLNDTFTNAHAVLIGDYMMCSVIDFALDFNHSNEVIKLMVGAIKKLVTGIIIEQTILPEDPTKANYLEMADLKTGALFELSIGLPFIAHEQLNEAMECGRIFGLLFQMYDDYTDRTTDVQYQNIFHIVSAEEAVAMWNENCQKFLELARVLQIDSTIMEMVSYLRARGFFQEVTTSGGILFKI